MPLPEYKQLVEEAKREIKEIDPAELKRMQEQKQNFTLIDVREPDEVAEGAIAGSKPLPRGQLEHKIDTITIDKNEPIVCYCGGGGRSALAAQSLKKMGFKDVMSLAGGIKGGRAVLSDWPNALPRVCNLFQGIIFICNRFILRCDGNNCQIPSAKYQLPTKILRRQKESS
jgi:phage shock protein E